MEKIKVLIVDDSAVVRKIMAQVLESDPGIEIIGVAPDPIFAQAKMQNQWPDVIVLDIEMPRMDGITFLRKIMDEHPTPVIICSTLAEKNAHETMQALSAGAVGIFTKPKVGLKAYIQEEQQQFVQAVKSAANANMTRLKKQCTQLSSRQQDKHTADVMMPPPLQSIKTTTERIVAIGTSTGGTQALEQVFTRLPRVCPGIVVVQHMPEKFTQAFASRLNSMCQIEVLEAKDGDRVMPGRALIAPGGRHMMLKRSGAQYQVVVTDGPLVNRHRPSVDVLFRSVAQHAGKNALGIIMTGMGDDGAHGIKEMHQQGAYTLAQDEETCIVFGMPKEAIKLGGVDKVVTLADIPSYIVQHNSQAA